MRKVIKDIGLSVLLLMLSVSSHAASYTVSDDSISGVPYYTTAEDFAANLSGTLDGEVVVESADGETYTVVDKKGYVNEQCLFESGGKHYTVSLNTLPLPVEQLANGKGYSISVLKNYDSNIAVGFTMNVGESFSEQSAILRTAGKDSLVFRTEADGLISLTDVSGNKVKFARYAKGGKICAELYLERNGTVFSVSKVYVNGREYTFENSLSFNMGTNASVIYRTQNTSETLKSIFALSVDGYRPVYNPSMLEAVAGESGVYKSYGTRYSSCRQK